MATNIFGGVPAAPASPARPKADSEDFVKEEEVTQIEGWKASMTLEVKDVASGEEQDDVVWTHRAKLLRFCKDSSEWKERAIGDAKLLKNRESGKIRFLVRQEKTSVIRANHLVVNAPPLCELTPNGNSGKIWVWSCQDFSEEEPKLEMFALKFGNAEAAEGFKQAFEAATKTNASLSPSSSPAVKGALPKSPGKKGKDPSPKVKGKSPKGSPKKGPADAKVEKEVDQLAEKIESKLKLGEGDPVVSKLRSMDDDYLSLQRKYDDELALLQTKFEKKWNPLLEQRAAELKKGASVSGCGTPGVKGFWLQVLKNADEIKDLIMEWDEPVLEAVSDIKFEWLDNKGRTGWKLHLTFVENEYLSNKVLTKTYTTSQTSEYDSSLDYEKITVDTPLEWKLGKDITVELVAKKVKGGGKKKQKQKGKMEERPRPSFFRAFFRNLGEDFDLPSDIDMDDEDSDDEDFDVMDMMIQDDVESSEALRDTLIPHAVRWYTGEACDSSDEEEDDDDDDDEEEEDSDDDEDDDEDEDDDADDEADDGDAPKTGLFGKPPADGEQKQECKQQ